MNGNRRWCWIYFGYNNLSVISLSQFPIRFFSHTKRNCLISKPFHSNLNLPDLEPIDVRGWFWTGSGVKLGTNPAGTRVAGHWSNAGGDGRIQPDNREYRVTVNCLISKLLFLFNFSRVYLSVSFSKKYVTTFVKCGKVSLAVF